MLEVVAVKSDSDLLGSAGVSPAVFGVPPNTRCRPAVNPLGETPSGATGRSELDSGCTVSVLVALPSQPEPLTVRASLDAFALGNGLSHFREPHDHCQGPANGMENLEFARELLPAW